MPLMPHDLQRFLARKGKLKGDFKKAETGGIGLISLKEAKVGWLYVAPGSSPKDPNRNCDGCYYVPAVNLIKRCVNYPPYGILVFLPFEGIYATWDCDHAALFAFPAATWGDIAANPLHFTDYQWKPSATVHDLRLWERYEFKTTEERHPC
ncbi:MAG TPA: hypothetical protein VHX44_00315 [Planctomycetota bacterium]|nr:hypothetical protein [Planctomycetota bacterium]